MSVFQVGDIVRVVRKITERDQAVWNNSWNDSGMDPLLNNGEVYEVTCVDCTSVYVAGYCWHPDSLELVRAATTMPTPDQVQEILARKIDSVEAAQQTLKDLGDENQAAECTEDNFTYTRDAQRVARGYFKLIFPPGTTVPQDAFLHVSKCGTMVSFAESEDKRKRDVWQKMKYGRYLAKYHPELNNEQVKKAVAAFDYEHGAAPEVHFGETEEDFINAIANGPSESCMSGKKLNHAGHIHPAAVYAAGDIKVAWLEDGERITARTLINKETKKFSRVYGDEEKLKKLLEDAGYEQSKGALVGCRIKKIENRNGDGHIMCYIDAGIGSGGGSLSVSDKGEHFLTNDERDGFDTHEAYSNNGVTCEGSRSSCDRCGDTCDEEDLTYVECDEYSVCQFCLEDRYVYAVTRVRNGRIVDHDYVREDYAIYIECLDEFVREDLVCELNIVMDDERNKYINSGASVLCVDGCYHHIDDCTQIGTNSDVDIWIHENHIEAEKKAGHLYTKDGALFWHESDEVAEWKASEGEEGYDPEEYVSPDQGVLPIEAQPEQNDWRSIYRWMQDQGIRFLLGTDTIDNLNFGAPQNMYSIDQAQQFPDNWRETYIEAQRRGLKFSWNGCDQCEWSFNNYPETYQVFTTEETSNETTA